MKKIKFQFGKKAALELSIGTIVIIVIAMSMLILGIVLVRQVMCSGIVLTEEVTRATENQIKDLFGSSEIGVKCMGEAGDEVKLGGGGRRQVVCVINEINNAPYKIELSTSRAVEGYGGIDDATAKSMIVRSGWEGDVTPGTRTVTVAVLDVQRNIPDSQIYLPFDVTLPSGAKETHNLNIDLVPTSAFTAAIC